MFDSKIQNFANSASVFLALKSEYFSLFYNL